MANPFRTVLAVSALVFGALSSPASLSTSASALGPAPAGYRIDAWTSENGLPQNSVHAMVQTRDGYLWLATSGGLVRFDGVAFTIVGSGARDGLRSIRIRALIEDHTGALWIGTESAGLSRYANGHFTHYTRREGLPADTVSFLHEDAQGRVWFATEFGLGCIENGRVRVYTDADGLPFLAVTVIASDRHGTVWVGTLHGLARLEGNRFRTIAIRAGTATLNYVQAILQRRDGSLWIGSDIGIMRIAGDEIVHYTTSDGLPGNSVRCLLEDADGHLWIATDDGLAQFHEGAERLFTAYTRADGLSENAVSCLLQDREGVVWAGTNTGGLNRLKPRSMIAYGRAEGIPGGAVVPITQDADGTIWIGLTCGGLVRYREGTFTTFGMKDGLKSDCVWSLLPAREGGLWVGTWGGGFFRFKDGVFTQYSEAQGLSHNAASALYEDPDGVLWIGTASGLNRFEHGTFRVYKTGDGLLHDEVRYITRDRDGALWIGTSGGISVLRDGRFRNYTTDDGLSYPIVREIHQTEDGAMWIGTYGGGLNRFKDGVFTRYTTREGMFENIVSRILDDGHGNFWMTGNNGIARVSRRELEDFAAGKIGSITSFAYGVPDGMHSNECNGGGQPAGWKAQDGTLWFPTQKGVVTIDPKHLARNPVPPPVVIEQVLIDRRPQDHETNGIDVPPGASDLEIQYTGLSFAAPERVRFRYKLAGLDDHWIEAGTRRVAYYSHVPPGRYTFTVLASNGDGVWNETGATLAVRIIPPFYRTRWFMTLAGAAVVGLVLLTYERRIRTLTRARQLQETFSRRLIESQERERKRVAAELHDSLSQTLVVIKNRALVSLQTPDDPRRAFDQMDEIAEAATAAIDEVKEISYNLRPYHLDRLGLTKAIDAMIDKVADTPQSRGDAGVRFTKALDSLDDVFPKEAEINVYRIVQECVTNIIKHAHATEASVTMMRDNGVVSVTIRDNGKGFVPHSKDAGANGNEPRGFGLIGIAERARLFGGEPQIHSVPGQGTTIHMTLAVDNKVENKIENNAVENKAVGNRAGTRNGA